MEIYDPNKDKRDIPAVTGLGFSSEKFEEALTIAEKTKKKERLAAKDKIPKEGIGAAGAAGAAEVDEELIRQILAEEEKKARKKKRFEFLKRPTIRLALGTLLLVPGVLFPWFRFFADKPPLSAFRLPVVFLFADGPVMLPQLTVGMVIAGLFVLNLILVAWPRRIATFMQVFAILSIFLTVGVLLLSLRHWNAMTGLGKDYQRYLLERSPLLPKDPYSQFSPNFPNFPIFPFFPRMMFGAATGSVSVPAAPYAGAVKKPGLPGNAIPQGARVKTATVKNPAASDMAAKWAQSGKPIPVGGPDFSVFGFFCGVLRLGVLFPLLSGAAIFWTCNRFAGKLRHLEFQLPVTIAAVLIVAGGIFLVFFLFARILPARWYYTQSELMRLVNRNDAARKRLEFCVELAAPNYVCRNALALSYWNAGRVRDARNIFISVARERPNFPDVHRDLADLYFNERSYWRAAVHYRKYMKMRPNDLAVRKKLSTTLIHIGNENYSRGRFTKAARFYTEALDLLSLNKTDTVLQYKLGDSYYQLGKIGKALEHFRVVADLQPHDFEQQIHVAKVCEEKGDYRNALLYFKRSIAAKPDNSMSYVYVGNLYRDVWKNSGKAEEWYQKGIDANPVSDGAEAARQSIENLHE